MICSRIVRLFLFASLIAPALSADLYAKIRPSFEEHDVAWNADEIVLAQAIDAPGMFVVLEVWKGHFAVGQQIDLPEMKEFETRTARTLGCWWNEPECQRRELTTRQIVLFLKATAPDKPSTAVKYTGASGYYATMQPSFAWIEDGDVYAFVQVMNPGPSLLVPLSESESKLRSAISEDVALRKDFDEALAIRDPRERAEALARFLSAENYAVPESTMAELGKIGKAALPVMERLVEDDNYLHQHHRLIELISKIDDPSVVPFLQEQLRRQILFWKEKGPTLPNEWWNLQEEIDVRTERLRSRYIETYTTLAQLTRLNDRSLAIEVAEFRDFWLKIPQLRSYNQMAQQCDGYLKGDPSTRLSN